MSALSLRGPLPNTYQPSGRQGQRSSPSGRLSRLFLVRIFRLAQSRIRWKVYETGLSAAELQAIEHDNPLRALLRKG